MTGKTSQEQNEWSFGFCASAQSSGRHPNTHSVNKKMTAEEIRALTNPNLSPIQKSNPIQKQNSKPKLDAVASEYHIKPAKPYIVTIHGPIEFCIQYNKISISKNDQIIGWVEHHSSIDLTIEKDCELVFNCPNANIKSVKATIKANKTTDVFLAHVKVSGDLIACPTDKEGLPYAIAKVKAESVSANVRNAISIYIGTMIFMVIVLIVIIAFATFV